MSNFFPSHALLFSFIVLVLSIASIIIGLDCIWRAEKRLKTFFILLTLSVVFTAISKVLGILGLGDGANANNIYIGLELLTGIFLLASFAEFYRIVRALDNENPPQNPPPAQQ